jgi:hypothetical protein
MMSAVQWADDGGGCNSRDQRRDGGLRKDESVQS